MPVRPQLTPEQNAQPIADWKAAVQELTDAMLRLTLAWEKLDQAGKHAPDEAIENYPFDRSFDELYHAAIEWAHDVENAPDETFGSPAPAAQQPEGRKPMNAAVTAALYEHEAFKRRVAQRIKQSALDVVAEWERKTAVALTNEGYGTNSKCYKCKNTIGEGELSTWEGGMECHAGRCPAPAAQVTPEQRSQRIQNMPQRGAPKSEQQLGLTRREQTGYAPMASEK
jgi:hypothetical protein